MTRETHLFHHIPKAAGMTFQIVLMRQYPLGAIFQITRDKRGSVAVFRGLPPERRSRYALIMGHQALRLVDDVEGPRVITLLREPVARVISLYHFARAHPNNPMHEAAMAADIETFFEQGRDAASSEFRNGQFHSLKRLIDARAFGGGVEAAPLEALQAILEQHVLFGLVERFDESIHLFKRRLGWRSPLYYSRRNVTRYETPHSDGLVARIREHNAADLALYDFAAGLFDRRVEEQGEAFRQELDAFQVRNRAGGRAATQPMRIKRFLLRARMRVLTAGGARGGAARP